jgi:hypothetical protein
MAQAPGHRLGQIIGETLELAIGPPLSDFAARHGLYLDTQEERPARAGKKVRWRDSLGNTHDLDYVLERGGTRTKLGLPVAFIETAWRRYTKHSRNKAQEIQGAILPLLNTWAHIKPFAGVVLAGVWTEGSLDQLRSNGFSVLYIPYHTIIDVFRQWDIEIYYEESTEDLMLARQIERWEKLSDDDAAQVGQLLRDVISNDLKVFMDHLSRTVLRRIDRVSILPLRGRITDCQSIAQAIDVIRSYDLQGDAPPIVRFEVIVRYDNDDRVTADFASQADAVAFLNSFT